MRIGLPNSQVNFKGYPLAKAQRNLENASRKLVKNADSTTFFANVRDVADHTYPISPEDAWKTITTTIQSIPEKERSVHKSLSSFLQVARQMLGVAS